MRISDLRRVYVMSGLLYMSVVFAIGTLGVVALAIGVEPTGGDLNLLVPTVASRYLPVALIVPFILLILAAVTSTSDSDLAALSSIAMADVRRGYLDPHAADDELLLVGRLAMVLVATIGVAVALLRIDILTLILFYGMIRAASVFPIAASIVWDRVSNAGFSAGVITAIVAGTAARIAAAAGPDDPSVLVGIPALAGVATVLAAAGAATMAGALAFPFLRWRAALLMGVVTGVVILVVQLLTFPGMLGYAALLSTLVALGTGMVVCTAVSLAGQHRFDWDHLELRVRPITAAEPR